MQTPPPNIFDYNLKEWEYWVQKAGHPRYRAGQIFAWLHRLNATDVVEMGNLPQALRARLATEFVWPREAQESRALGADGTAKLLYLFPREKVVETVWLPYEKRQSICISVQSGCSLNCSFCATGKIDFKGNLSAGEIVAQVYLTQKAMGRRVTNVVFMGMGEPFYNYDNVMKAADLLNDPNGMNIGARHITISTSGILPGIERFIQEKRPYGLALSLHAVFPDKRAQLMNIEEKYPFQQVVGYLERNRASMRKSRLTFEYIMIREKNMGYEDARELARLARRLRAKVNLIPLNTSFGGMVRPSEEEIQQFHGMLSEFGITAMNRRSPGKDIDAACGMLAGGQLALK